MPDQRGVVVTDTAIHAGARMMVWLVYGDWRYDPGEAEFEWAYRDAKRVLEEAVPFMEVTGA